MARSPSRFLLSIVLTVANRSRSSEMITICQVQFIYMTCHLGNSFTTLELPTLSVMPKENGCSASIWSMASSLDDWFSSPVQDRFTAAVKVVKLLLGDRVIHIHGRDTQFASLRQLVQSEKTQGGNVFRQIHTCTYPHTNWAAVLCDLLLSRVSG